MTAASAHRQEFREILCALLQHRRTHMPFDGVVVKEYPSDDISCLGRPKFNRLLNRHGGNPNSSTLVLALNHGSDHTESADRKGSGNTADAIAQYLSRDGRVKQCQH